MSFTRSLNSAICLAALLLFPTTRLLATRDDSPAPTSHVYSDNAAGLRQFLQDMLAAAKSDDQFELSTIIKETEIPDYETWYTSTFGQEKGESWAEPYGKMLDEHEKEFEELIKQLAHQDGKISIRKVDASKRYDTLKGKLDLFLADWEHAGTRNDANTHHIGYFMFIDGKFRWDSTVEFIRVERVDFSNGSVPQNDMPKGAGVQQSLPAPSGETSGGPFSSGKNGVGYPSCVYCPDPAYTEEAIRAKFHGSVVLQVIVGPDGLPTNIQTLKTPGLGLDEKAIEAVRKWRFKPALGPQGNPVAVITPIVITFRNPQ